MTLGVETVGVVGLVGVGEIWQLISSFRQTTEKELKKLTRTLVRSHEKEKKKKPHLICTQCGNLITNSDAAISIAGQHRHTFINPAGIPYEIACFSTAPGCIDMGEPTMEFTWFPGYTWCYSVCGQCFTHMGWYYQSGDSHFYGLILNRLRSRESI